MRVVGSARQSVYQNVETWFASAGSNIMPNLYHVYGETELRDATFTPVRPFIYVLDYGVQYEYKHLPVILVQMETGKRGFQLGSNLSYRCQLALHVIGRSRGERDDLASAIMETVDTLDLYNYNSGTPTLDTTVNLEQDRVGDFWTVVGGTPTEPQAQQGTLSDWLQLATEFWVMGNSLAAGEGS